MTLLRARGEHLRRIKLVLGDVEYVLPTEAGIAKAVVNRLPYVGGIAWRMLGPGLLVAQLRLRWWAFFTFGWLHARALRLGREIVDKHKPAGVQVLVIVWG